MEMREASSHPGKTCRDVLCGTRVVLREFVLEAVPCEAAAEVVPWSTAARGIERTKMIWGRREAKNVKS